MTMKLIFLSPHLDDAILSCGAVIDQFVENGKEVEIWTIFAGDPPDRNYSSFALSLHQRWKTHENPVKIRREEDIKACQALNVRYKHFSLPDCIYRKVDSKNYLINGEEDLYQPIPNTQISIVNQVKEIINSQSSENDIFFSPITIGNHVDHRIVRTALEQSNHIKIAYYADYPYVVKNQVDISTWINPQWCLNQFQLTFKNVTQWIEAISQHKSQISTFWNNIQQMQEEIINYEQNGGGKFIWIGPHIKSLA